MPAPKNGIKKHNGGGASKAKGQIRAKSGCYTCRIRRKKCDEARNNEGRCANCERLKVQCLGFGPKRPDWLKDKQSDLIKRIKAHCAGSGKNRASTSSPQASDYLMLLPQVLLPTDESDGDMSPHDSPASHTSFELSDYHDYTTPTPQMLEPLYPFDETSALSSSMSTFDATFALSTLDSTVATHSQLGPSYNLNLGTNDWSSEFSISEPYPYGAISPLLIPGDTTVHLYVNDVAHKQFLLVDRSTLASILSEPISNSSGGLASSAVRLLLNIHAQRQVQGERSCLADRGISNQYEDIKQLLSLRRRTHVLTADEAWAALFVISSFLFDGGRGEWDMWIKVACQYARRIIQQDPRYALDFSQRFLIKAAIWFDVLSAITTRRTPNMIIDIRERFSPQMSGIQDPDEEEDDVMSMMSPMGCESRVVWALAETLDLAAWKEASLAHGALSVPKLYEHSRRIEACLSRPRPRPPCNSSETALKRHFCSEMFRVSTILFLQAVVSGNYPAVPEIELAVKEIFNVLDDMQTNYPAITPSVVRMTVFSFFLCGSLTDDQVLRGRILAILSREGSVGNCSSLGHLLQHKIWPSRTQSSPHPVLWREALEAEKMLLV